MEAEHVATGMRGVITELPRRLREHNLTLVSAGVAFYAFLAVVPTLIALVSLYGLVANPDDVERQVENVAGALPEDVKAFVVSQLTSIARADRAGVSLTLVASVAFALWSASGGMAALITGLHVAHEEAQPKSFVARRGKALALTVGALVVLGALVWLLAFLPAFIEDIGFGDNGRRVLAIVRWPFIAGFMVAALGLLYRFALVEQRRLVSFGAVVGTALWLLASALFSVYTANFGRYSETYGTLATIVVMLLWLFLSALAVLVGAELDAIRAAR